MIKTLFVIETLGAGGAERVLVNLVNQMDYSQFDVTVLTLFDDGVNVANLFDAVHYTCLHKRRFRGIKTVFKLLPKRLLYRFYLAPHLPGRFDLIVAYMTGVPTFLVAGAPQRKIAWLHGEFFKGRNSFGQRHIYDRFDAVAGVSRYTCEAFERVIGSKRKAEVVYNTNDVARIRSLAKEPFEQTGDGLHMVTVGCLEKTKGFDRLLHVCARLKQDGFAFHLAILGEGVEREALQTQIDDLLLQDCVSLRGFVQNPYPAVAAADLFICSSRTEGLSTAVSEAIILGVPVVSTDVSGAKEILGEKNEYGLVTDNSEEGLYEGLKRMLSDPAQLAFYRAQAAKRAPFFETKATVQQAETLFAEVMQ